MSHTGMDTATYPLGTTCGIDSYNLVDSSKQAIIDSDTADSNAVAYITNTRATDDILSMHKNTIFSDLNLNLKADVAEMTIKLQATTRGDISVQKSIFFGVKKACDFKFPTALATASYIQEFVFDRGSPAQIYGLSDLITVLDATTDNVYESSTYKDWTGSCSIDMIIYDRASDAVASVNKT